MREAASGTWSNRFKQMVFGWGMVAVVYFSVGYLDNTPVVLSELWLDKQLTFTPHAVWAYLSFFLFIPYTYFTVNKDRLLRLRYSMQISAVVAGVIFYVLPTQLNFPVVEGDGVSVALLQLLMKVDSTQNCLPSLHASLSLICVLALWDNKRLLRSLLSLVVGAVISVSIVKLRRHLSIDLGAGLFLGAVAFYFAESLERAVLREGQKGQ